uniref:C2H2-type domain-containing protein n=1 Tax=Haemonchus contortus TaxID=6289 RepID=A0A7I4Z124_HAECO
TSMEAFLEQLRVLRFQFDALSSEDHEDALAAVAETVCEMRDASVRRRFEKEIELTLAWEAEKMIAERFVGDWSSLNCFNEPTTSSYDFESPSVFESNNQRKDAEFTWDGLPNRADICSEDKRKTASPFTEKSELQSSHVPKATSRLKGREDNEAYQHFDEQVLSRIGITNSASSPTSRAGNAVGKENRLVCATCGFSANNRKALYRHGLKTQHVLRESNSTGSLICSLCSFRTNKVFNYNRHMKRFHGDELKESPCSAT